MERLPEREIAAPRRRDPGDRRSSTALADRKPDQLSGGQKQRVALARALVKRPRVLLLDEPLAALDKKLREQMQLELKRLQHEVGITFVIVTHDQEEALVMADRMAVLKDGRLLQCDTPEEIYEQPADRFVADFIGVMNFLEGRADAGRPSRRTGSASCRSPTGVGGARSTASAAVRPERIQLVLAPERGRPNRLPAAVEALPITGSTSSSTSARRLSDSRFSCASPPTPPTAGRSRAGDTVEIGWDAADTRIFAD